MAFGLKNSRAAESDPLALAKEKLRQSARKLTAIIDGIEGRENSLSLIRNPDDARGDRTVVTRAKAAPYFEAVRRRPDRAELEILDLREQVDDVLREHKDAEAEVKRLESLRDKAISEAAAPRIREAARKIAAALSQLDAAITSATELERDIRSTASNPTSPRFVGISNEIAGWCSLKDHRSAASTWTKRLRESGIL